MFPVKPEAVTLPHRDAIVVIHGGKALQELEFVRSECEKRGIDWCQLAVLSVSCIMETPIDFICSQVRDLLTHYEVSCGGRKNFVLLFVSTDCEAQHTEFGNGHMGNIADSVHMKHLLILLSVQYAGGANVSFEVVYYTSSTCNDRILHEEATHAR